METTTEGKKVVTWLPINHCEPKAFMEEPIETTIDISTIHGLDVCEIKSKAELTAEEIQSIVSKNRGVSIELMRSKIRKREVVLARQLAISFIKDKTTLSLKAIGDLFGGRDHSTVIHAIQSINDLNDTDKKFRKEFEYLKSII